MTGFPAVVRRRRDTSATLALANPIIPDGQRVHETDTRRAKIGNGTDHYLDLPYEDGEVVAHVAASDPHGDRAYSDARVADLSGVTDPVAAWEALAAANLSQARRRYSTTANRGGTGRTVVGHAAPNPGGTAQTSTDVAAGVAQDWVSASSSGAVAGGPLTNTGGTGSEFQLRWQPIFTIKFRAQSSSEVRYFVGFADGTIGSADDPSASNVVALRYSTGASDPGWVVYTSNGSASTVSEQVRAYSNAETIIVTVDARDPAAIEFWIGTDESDMQLVHTATDTLPGNSVSLRPIAQVTTLNAVGKRFTFSHMQVSHL